MNKTLPKVHFKNNQNHLGFEIQTLEYIYNHPKFSDFTVPHQIAFYCIILVTKGIGKHLINFNTYSLEKGTVLFTSINQVQAFTHSNSVKGYVVLFTEDFLNKNQLKFNDLSYSFPFNFGLYNTCFHLVQPLNQLNRLFEYIYEEYQTSLNPETEEQLQCLLRTIMLKIKSYSKKENPENTMINSPSNQLFIQFQQLLEKHITIRSATYFCNKLKVSYSQLNNITKKITGHTLKAFMDKNTILRAKQQLSLRTHNISEIAISLGFEEPTNFTKFFKKRVHQSPSAFQKSLSLD